MSHFSIGSCKKCLLLVFLLSIVPYLCFARNIDTTRVNDFYSKASALHYVKPDSAIYFYQKILDHYELVKKQLDFEEISELDSYYIETVIKAINRTGDIYYYDDEYKRSETYYKQSLNISEKSGLSYFKAKALYDIGYIRYMNNQYKEANQFLEKAYNQYAELNMHEGMYCTLNARGLSNYKLGNFNKADSIYRQALTIAEYLNDSIFISDIQIHLGILYCEQGRLEEGITLFEKSLDYYEQAGSIVAVSDALLNIGVVMQMAGEYNKALDYMEESVSIVELSQVKSQLAIRYYHLADLYMDMHQNEKAYAYCQKTLVVAEEIASKPLAGECNFLMGKYFMAENDYDEAIDHFKTALELVNTKENKTLSANVNLWYSNALVQLNLLEQAIEKANNAYVHAKDLNLISIQKDASYILFKCYKGKGDLADALNWFEVYFNVSDSINYYEQQKEIQRIEAHYNFEKKERENEILRNKTSLQEQRLKNRTVTVFALILGIILSIVAIILLVSRIKYARALNREQQMLSLQQLEVLNKELDGKERELATKMMFLNQKNDLIGRIINQLQEIQNDPDVDYGEINSLVNELRTDAPQSNWKEFETQFVQVHPDFYKRLFKKYPDLTSYEQRICAFLRMNLNTKEIAAITGRSSKSIEVTRSRIRQKLHLSRKDNLGSFLASI